MYLLEFIAFLNMFHVYSIRGSKNSHQSPPPRPPNCREIRWSKYPRYHTWHSNEPDTFGGTRSKKKAVIYGDFQVSWEFTDVYSCLFGGSMEFWNSDGASIGLPGDSMRVCGIYDICLYTIMPSCSDVSITVSQPYLLEHPRVLSNKTGDAL